MNYRLSQDLGGVSTAPGVDTYTDQLSDLAAAFVLLQNEAETWALDTARFFVGGHCAGGQLAHELNLRWDEFAPTCTNPSGCPPPAGAIGLEGIYDIAAWDEYDASFWGGFFHDATRKAFGSPASAPPACMDPLHGLPCWDVGSPTYLAQHGAALGIAPAGDVLIVHSPGDDWVDVAQSVEFAAAMGATFPAIEVVTSTDGGCATGQHNELLAEPALADCIVGFVAPGSTNAISVPLLTPPGLVLLAIVLAAAGRRLLTMRGRL
jgi:acetyl esterase/lipase